MSQFDVNLISLKGASLSETEKLGKALHAWKTVWNSEEFKEAVINYSWSKTVTTKTGFWPFRKTVHTHLSGNTFQKNEGLSNQQILDALLNGAEALSPEANQKADIKIEVKGGGKGVLGYTKPGIVTQYIYRHFLKSGTPEDIAGNLSHEYCHKLGFGHDFKATPLRPFSVPYAIGYLTRDLAKKLF